MSAKRIAPAAALICLLAGCQTYPVDREAILGSGVAPLAAPVETSTEERGEPLVRLPSSRTNRDSRTFPSDPVFGGAAPAVRVVSHNQPAEPPESLESLHLPDFRPPDLAAREDLDGYDLTLTALEEIALANNPTLAEARALVNAASGRWLQVGLPPNTVVGYSGQQLGSGGQAEQQGLYIGQEFVRGGKLSLSRAVASQQIQKAEQHWVERRQRVVTDVRLGYYDTLVAQRRIVLAGRLVDSATKALATADALFQAGEVSQIDVARARVVVQKANLRVENARRQREASWSKLSAVLGAPSETPRQLVGDIDDIPAPIDPNTALMRILAESPEMAIAMAEVDRAQWAIARARAEPTPNLDLQAVVQNDNGTGSSNVNVQLSMPIPWRNQNQGAIQQAQSEWFAAQHAVDRVELDLQHRFAIVYQRYASAENEVREYTKNKGILENTNTALEFVRGGYEAGELVYLDLLTEQTTFSQTNVAYLDALGEFWAAIVEIDGLLLKNSLSEAM